MVSDVYLFCFFTFGFSSSVLGTMLEVSLDLTLSSYSRAISLISFSIILNGIDLDLGRVLCITCDLFLGGGCLGFASYSAITLSSFSFFFFFLIQME